MSYPFEFNLDKGIETILYLAENLSQPSFHQVSKLPPCQTNTQK